MPMVTTKDGTEIFYKDWGAGEPIFFHHGWPLSADDWDAQMMFFLDKGYRVIAHDRRGHGRSTQTAVGHDMDPRDHCMVCEPCARRLGNPLVNPVRCRLLHGREDGLRPPQLAASSFQNQVRDVLFRHKCEVPTVLSNVRFQG